MYKDHNKIIGALEGQSLRGDHNTFQRLAESDINLEGWNVGKKRISKGEQTQLIILHGKRADSHP